MNTLIISLIIINVLLLILVLLLLLKFRFLVLDIKQITTSITIISSKLVELDNKNYDTLTSLQSITANFENKLISEKEFNNEIIADMKKSNNIMKDIVIHIATVNNNYNTFVDSIKNKT